MYIYKKKRVRVQQILILTVQKHACMHSFAQSIRENYGTFTSVSISGKLVAIIAGACVTSIKVIAVVVATSIVSKTLINVCTESIS